MFVPAEKEYLAAGDDSALHIIILDVMDAIARKRGTMTSDTTGVRDSVVNQLLATPRAPGSAAEGGATGPVRAARNSSQSYTPNESRWRS